MEITLHYNIKKKKKEKKLPPKLATKTITFHQHFKN